MSVAGSPLELALPLPISRGGRRGGNFDSDASDAVILKHGLVCGHGSFLFWQRSDLAGPHLVFVPVSGTHLEYWEGSREGGYRVFIHSAAAGAEIRARGGVLDQEPKDMPWGDRVFMITDPDGFKLTFVQAR